MTNFHTHTYLCKHAIGEPIEYAAVAAQHNFTALGFSDHCPYPDTTWIDCRMGNNEAAAYKNMVQLAKTESSVPIYFGYECEWAKKYKNWLSDTLIDEHGAQYLILGAHWVHVGNEFLYIPDITDKKTLLQYVDETIEGMASGLFAYLAHPDLFLERISDISPFYINLEKKIIEAAIQLAIPLEINGNGCNKTGIMRNGILEYRYPAVQFWQLAQEMGAHIIMAADAHIPADLVNNLNLTREFAAKYNISVDTEYMPRFFS